MSYTHPIAIVPGKSLEFFDGIGIWFFVLAILFVLVLLVTLLLAISRAVMFLVRFIATTVRLVYLGLVAPTFVFLSGLYSPASGRLASILSLLSYLSRPSALVSLPWSRLCLVLTNGLFHCRRLLGRLCSRLAAFCIRRLLTCLVYLDGTVTLIACEKGKRQAASENAAADYKSFWFKARSTVRAQKATIARLEQALTQKDEEATHAAQKIAKLEAELADARNGQVSEQARNADKDAQFKADNDKSKRLIHALRARMAKQEGFLAQARDGVAARTTQLDTARSEIAQMKARAQQDKAVKKSQNRELEDLTRDNVDLQAKYAQLIREHAAYKEQAATAADMRVQFALARTLFQEYEADNARALEAHEAELQERDQENARLRMQLALVHTACDPPTFRPGPAQPPPSRTLSSPSSTHPSTPSKPSTSSAHPSPSPSGSSPLFDQFSTDTIRPCIISTYQSVANIKDKSVEMGDPCNPAHGEITLRSEAGTSSSWSRGQLAVVQGCAQEEEQQLQPCDEPVQEESVIIEDQLAKFQDFSSLLNGDISLGDTMPDLSFPDREEKHEEEHQSLVSSSSSSAHCSTATVRPRCPTPAEDSSFTIQDKLRDVSFDLLHGDISLGAAQFDNSLSEEDEQENAKEPAQSSFVMRIDDNAHNLLDGDDSVVRAQGSSWCGNGSSSSITAVPRTKKPSSPGRSMTKTKGKGKGKEASRSGTLESSDSFPADLSAEFSRFSESVGNASTPAKRSRRRAKGRSPESPGVPSLHSSSTTDSLASSSPMNCRRSRGFLTPSPTSTRLGGSAAEPATPSPSPSSSKRARGKNGKAGKPLEPLAINVPRK